jgi:ABC-type lipoprotein export system ATPase subunit
MLIADQYFDMFHAYMNHVMDDFAICQALADPRNSKELTEFMQDIAHKESSSLMREHNEAIRTLCDENTGLHAEISRLQRERMENINAHAAEVIGLHGFHAAEIQGLHAEYTQKLKIALAETK